MKETPVIGRPATVGDSLQRFRPIARSGNVTEFAAMNAIPGLRKDIGNFYTQSTDFVGYLIENYGPDSIGKLLYELNSGKDIDTAMRAVYGGSLAQIENGWRNEWGLRSVSSPESPVDIQKDLPPTIPGLPTIKTGTLERLTENDSAQDPPVESRNSNHRTGTSCNASPTSHSRSATNDRIQHSAPPTPIPNGTNVYFTGTADDEWPQIKPSAIIVFVLLGLGIMALMYRRFKI